MLDGKRCTKSVTSYVVYEKQGQRLVVHISCPTMTEAVKEAQARMAEFDSEFLVMKETYKTWRSKHKTVSIAWTGSVKIKLGGV
jgi:hypothetical protein